VVTGRRGWATDFGVAEADQNLVDRLVASGLAAEDDEALSEEHSVGALMPYLKYHAPKARVLPIILHRDVPVETLQRLTDWLAEIVGPGRILLASVDFSHYLTRPEADKKDEITLQAIEAFDLDALRRMGPDHLDSPGSLSLLMLTMRKLRAAGPEMVGRDNSGSIIGNDLIETTSYFTFKFRLPNPGR
jgi:MEMO1 family protein